MFAFSYRTEFLDLNPKDQSYQRFRNSKVWTVASLSSEANLRAAQHLLIWLNAQIKFEFRWHALLSIRGFFLVYGRCGYSLNPNHRRKKMVGTVPYCPLSPQKLTDNEKSSRNEILVPVCRRSGNRHVELVCVRFGGPSARCNNGI